MALSYTPLTPAEEDWVAMQIAAAQTFVAEHCSEHANEPLTPAILDLAFSSWLKSDQIDPACINATINAVGIAFGSFLVQNSGFSWVIATDEAGTDLAVLALPGTADVTVFPANFVAKRWERGETGFLNRAFLEMSRQTRDIADARSSVSAKRSFWKRLTGVG